MSNPIVGIIVTIVPCLTAVGALAAPELPAGLHAPCQIETTRTKIAAGQAPWTSAYAALLEQVEEHLEKELEAVADFNVPGFYSDAEGHRNALATLARDAWAAYACAAAYQLTPGAARLPYADKAIEVLDAWATVNKQVSGYDGSLVMAYAGVGLVFAAQLMRDYDGWEDEGRARFSQWLTTVFLPTCRGIVDRSNNWGDWAVLGSIAANAFLADMAAVDADIAHIRKKIGDAIDADGSMPQETRREKRGIWYSYFALAPLTAACQVAANARGVDLFRYQAADGASIEKALDYLFHYCKHPEDWPHYTEADLAHPMPTRWPGNLFEAMSGIFDEKGYDAWVEEARPIMLYGHHYAWAMPTLLRPALAPGIRE